MGTVARGGEEEATEKAAHGGTSFPGGRVVKAQGQLLKAEMGGRALQRPAHGVCLAHLPALGQLFFSHTKTFASGYWLGEGQ